jgi:PAS domain S-box-containing protein
MSDKDKEIQLLHEELESLKALQQQTQSVLENLVRERTQDLEEHKEMYRTLSRVSPVGIFRSNLKGDFVYVNQKWIEVSGLTKKQCLGSGWLQSIYETERGSLYETWQEAVAEQIPFSGECRFITPEGKITWVLLQANVINGGGQGHVGSLTNITNKKIIVPELVALRDSFKVKVND